MTLSLRTPVERPYRILPAAHGVGVVAQRYDCVLVAGELGDQADLDALRLKGRDELWRALCGVTAGSPRRFSVVAQKRLRKLP